jgi:hypothetical protein
MNADLEVATQDIEAEAMVEDIRNLIILNILGDPVLEIDAIEVEADLIEEMKGIDLKEQKAALDVEIQTISREIAQK